MGPPPLKGRGQKKKGRPSVVELQRRSLRLENRKREASPEAGEEYDEDGDVSGSRRKEKKLKLVMGIEDGAGDSGGHGLRRLRDAVPDTRKEGKATGGGSQGPTALGVRRMATPMPDRKVLISILDRLQRKDKFNVFANPVDSEELPDYHSIIKCPMDFSTIRKKLDKGVYKSLEQFEEDVYLISSNAMSYNSQSSVYFRQARAILDHAQKDFESLRQESHAGESKSEPKPQLLSESESPPKRRRGRPPGKNSEKSVAKVQCDKTVAELSSGLSFTNAASKGHLPSTSPLGLSRTVIAFQPDASRGHSGFSVDMLPMRNCSRVDILERDKDHTGITKVTAKCSTSSTFMEENHRNTSGQPRPSISVDLRPFTASSYGERRSLVPISLQIQHSYPRSLARFAAMLGPVGWEIAARRIERSLPAGTSFGRGWVGDSEPPPPSQSSLLSASPPPQIPAQSEISTVQSDFGTAASNTVVPPNKVAPESVISPMQASSSSAIDAAAGVLKHEAPQGKGALDLHGKANEDPVIKQPNNGFLHGAGRSTVFLGDNGSEASVTHSQLDEGKMRLSHGDCDNHQVPQYLTPNINAGFHPPSQPASSLQADVQRSDLVLQL